MENAAAPRAQPLLRGHSPLLPHCSPVLLGLRSGADAGQEQRQPQGAEPSPSEGWKWE